MGHHPGMSRRVRKEGALQRSIEKAAECENSFMGRSSWASTPC